MPLLLGCWGKGVPLMCVAWSRPLLTRRWVLAWQQSRTELGPCWECCCLLLLLLAAPLVPARPAHMPPAAAGIGPRPPGCRLMR